ncbi:MAG TPA: HNH endonuclease signature motif containing protein [Gaiellaceae bacterium]
MPAIVGGQAKCLRAGEFCSPAHESDYEHYGFACVAGHLQKRTGGASPPSASKSGGSSLRLGVSVSIGGRTRTEGCSRGVLPDRRCSPGAYYSGLTSSVICSASFRTSTIRNVPQSEKFAVEREYRMPERLYGYTIEIDHIIPLELGGSNDIANLYPEPGSGPANYHVKDKLENRLHDLVCGGSMGLAAAHRGIATNWETQYLQVFGAEP